mgnify:CR=1 FL=1
MTDTAAHPWDAAYPAGLRWDAPLPLRPVTAILDDTVARFPERPALAFMGRTVSYRELGDLVARAARGLQQLGVGPGVHVGLYLPNTPHYIVSFFAVLKAGGVVVNYSPLDAEKVLEHKVADSRTDVLVTLDFAALYRQALRTATPARLPIILLALGETGSKSDAACILPYTTKEQLRVRKAALWALGQLDPENLGMQALLRVFEKDDDVRFDRAALKAHAEASVTDAMLAQ